MSNENPLVYSLILPLVSTRMILPQSVITEIIQRPEVTEIPGSASWLKGVFRWRTEQVPLLSFEEMTGAEENRQQRHEGRVVVVYALEEITGLVFYAFELQGIPHPVQLTRETVMEDATRQNETPVVGARVLINSQEAVIPDMSAVEHMIRVQLERI
ncbi:MAG: chemotaxis protein CheW [Gammaproteobacteria bacterium]